MRDGDIAAKYATIRLAPPGSDQTSLGMDWNQRYQESDTPWARGEPAPPLVEYLAANSLAGCRVLVPGCGLGHDVRFLASQGCDALGIDLSSVALERAKAYPPPSGGAASYALCDFLDPNSPLPSAEFDCVFEHTCFCTIDPSQRSNYVEAAQRVLKPGGRVLAIFFTELEDQDGPPYSTSPDAIEALFSPYFQITSSWKPNRVFPGRENEETMFLLTKR